MAGYMILFVMAVAQVAQTRIYEHLIEIKQIKLFDGNVTRNLRVICHDK